MINKLIELFKNHDIVTFKLTGLGEQSFNTEEFEEAVLALEKQKGKIVKEDVVIKIGYNGYRYKRERPLCPSCNNIDLALKQPYCNICGQKLLWEVEE